MTAFASRFAHWPPELRPTRGTFEMAKAVPTGSNALGGVQMQAIYEETKCWMVGPIAVHRVEGDRSWPWKLSHAATGMALPCAYGRNVPEAADVARAVATAIDWSLVKRGKEPGAPVGMTKEMIISVSAMVQSFRFLAPFVKAMRSAPK